MNSYEYQIVLTPLCDDDGGGFLAHVPDLPGCMADGETPSEALENIADAITCWIETQEERGDDVPVPGQTRQEIQEQRAREAEQAAQREELISTQKALIDSLNKRCVELEQQASARVFVGWREPVSYEHPASSGLKGTDRLAVEEPKPSGPAAVLQFPQD